MRASVRLSSRAVASAATPGLRAAICLVGLVGAVAVRVVVAGAQGPGSLPAGVVFAGVLGALCLAVRALGGTVGARAGGRAVLWGVAGGAALCAPPLIRHGGAAFPPASGYVAWALVVTLVAVAEEALLRGVLFAAVAERAGPVAAVSVGALAFAVLHVPLYGASVFWLDLGVGAALGVLRVVSGSVTAPVLAHTLADLAGWWLR